jgi:cellulose biosynthesis protein BcsQ
MRTFAVYSIKGGVGKTATAVNLAYLSAREGARTLLWDLDPQGAATFYFRVRPKVKGGARGLVRREHDLDRHIRGSDFSGLDILPADFSYRNLDLDLHDSPKAMRRVRQILKPLRESYDHVLIDCAPSISLVSESVFAASESLLVPTIPTPLSLRTLAQLVKHLLSTFEQPPRVIPFFCMVDRRKGLHRATCDDSRAPRVGFLRTVIPYSSVVEQMGLHRNPLPFSAPRHPLSLAYESLWHEALERLEDKTHTKPPSPKSVRRLLDEPPSCEQRSADVNGRDTGATAPIADEPRVAR